MASITITTSSFGAINSTLTGQAPATITLALGVPGPGVVAGGTINQILAKKSSTNYDTQWVNPVDIAAQWGHITGTLSAQTDLQTALSSKLNTSGGEVSGPITMHGGTIDSEMSSGFFGVELTSDPTQYAELEYNALTVAGGGSSTQVTPSGVTFPNASVQTSAAFVPGSGDLNLQGYSITDANFSSSAGQVSAQNITMSSGGVLTFGDATVQSTAGLSRSDANSYYYPLIGNPNNYLTSGDASSLYQTISGMSAYLTTASAASTYAPKATPTFTGTVTIPTPATSDNSTTAASTAFVKAQGYLTSAPVTSVAGRTGAVTLSTTDISGISSYAPLASPSLTGTPLAPTAAANTNTTQVATTAFVLGQGNATAATIAMNGTQAAGTSNLYARADHVHPSDTSKANLASPTFTGTPAAPTAAASTNTTQVATTAFVLGQASSTTPVVDGTATIGTATTFARADHVHPTDTSRAALASPTFTGTPLSTTAAADTNTTQIATTAFVVGQASATTPVVDGTATIGTSLKYARADHVHPTDTSRAPLASPTFTGTVTIPSGASISGFAPLASPTFTGTPSLPTGTTAVTQTAGNNTTAVATTAFVTSAVPAFASETQAIVGTSSTTAISPLLMRYILANAGYTAYTSIIGNYASYISGSGSVAAYSNLFGTSITAANGKAAFLPSSNVSFNCFQSRGKAELNLDWSKPMWFSFRFNYSSSSTIGDSNTVNRVTVGKVTSVFGDLASAGFGVKWVGGTTGAFTVMAHNGSALSTSASSVTVSNTTYFPSTVSAADFMVYSDGAGNITLYCNNVQVATTTGGPSSGTVAGCRFTFESDNTTSTSGTLTCDFSGVRSMLSY